MHLTVSLSAGLFSGVDLSRVSRQVLLHCFRSRSLGKVSIASNRTLKLSGLFFFVCCNHLYFSELRRYYIYCYRFPSHESDDRGVVGVVDE